jgi:hypothetical protein
MLHYLLHFPQNAIYLIIVSVSAHIIYLIIVSVSAQIILMFFMKYEKEMCSNHAGRIKVKLISTVVSWQ